jgi:hypothetical protein
VSGEGAAAPLPRPADLARLWLATLTGPPRERARDGRADAAGIEALRGLLRAVVEADPEAGDLEAVLAASAGGGGPVRSLAALVAQEWRAFAASPGSVGWLVAEAVEASAFEGRRRRGGWSAADGGVPGAREGGDGPAA